MLEFQVASVTKEEPPYRFIREFAKKAAEKYSGVNAAGVPILLEKVTEHFLSPYIVKDDLSRIPIGAEKEALEIVWL